MYRIELKAIGRNMLNRRIDSRVFTLAEAIAVAKEKCIELAGIDDLLIEHNNKDEYVVFHGRHYCGSLIITQL